MKTLRAVVATLAFAALPVRADLYAVVVEGLGGDDVYAERFAEQVDRIGTALGGLTAADNVRVFRSGEFERTELLAHFGTLGESLGADDRLAVFLIGHGSYDDHEYKFNIAGPDLTAADLAQLFDGVAADDVLLVNTSSASGAVFEPLNGDGRTLLLATRSGVERHATRFGHYFALALSDDAADLDKNRIVTAEEAFQFAARQVADFFERNGQLATEHPRLEGDQAARFSLARLDAPRAVRRDAELDRLAAERDRLNAAVDDLRQRRDTMTAEAYQQALLQGMLELATVEEAIENREAELANDE